MGRRAAAHHVGNQDHMLVGFDPKEDAPAPNTPSVHPFVFTLERQGVA
jgi:hypothetical protein